jgi:hypothetical protein
LSLLPLAFVVLIGIAPAAVAENVPASAVPAQQITPVDPALLQKARPIAAAILPDGTFARMMGPMMQKMMGPMMDAVGKMPIRDLLKIGGLDPAQIETMSPATIDKAMAILDPVFRERMKVMSDSIFPALGEYMVRFEPDMREGMSEAFAGRYTDMELDQVAAFLQTPTGAKFGSGFMTLATDPHYIGRVQAMMPRMMADMPAIMAKSAHALAKLPPARKYKDLSDAERARLAELLNIDPKKMTP